MQEEKGFFRKYAENVLTIAVFFVFCRVMFGTGCFMWCSALSDFGGIIVFREDMRGTSQQHKSEYQGSGGRNVRPGNVCGYRKTA